MKLRRSIALSVAAGAALLLAVPTTASATPSPSAPTGTRSLAEVLTANGNGQFDGNPFDYCPDPIAGRTVLTGSPAH
jgi:hypothetical protein